jgi:hypothetical protein
MTIAQPEAYCVTYSGGVDRDFAPQGEIVLFPTSTGQL